MNNQKQVFLYEKLNLSSALFEVMSDVNLEINESMIDSDVCDEIATAYAHYQIAIQRAKCKALNRKLDFFESLLSQKETA